MTIPQPAPQAPNGTARPGPRPAAARRPRRLSEDELKERRAADLDATRSEELTRKALAIAKLVGDDAIVCPTCKRVAPKGKFKIHPDGGWNHFSSTGCHGDAVGVLQSVGISFSDAVNVLLGRPTRAEIAIPEDLAALAARFVGKKSKISVDIFNGVLVYGRKTGGVEAAKEYYGQWHIAPEAVEAWGAVVIANPRRFASDIVERFGMDRLLECGLFTEGKNGPRSLISTNFPVVEPHRHPATGDVLYMQLRGSVEQLERYRLHHEDKEAHEYTPKFISLDGAPRSAQIGCGLDIIEHLPAGSDIYVVEGFKDGLAARTLGLYAYAIPGTAFRPPEKICQLLARHNVYVATDGDEAGIKARDGQEIRDEAGNVTGRTEGLIAYFERMGVANVYPADIGGPNSGMDITDFLIRGYASGYRNGGTPCPCPACARMRTDHPDWFPTVSNG